MTHAGTLATASGSSLPVETGSSSRVAEWLGFLGVVIQVAAVIALAYALRIEHPAFHSRLLPLLGIGFVVHHALPMRFRLPAFAALSIGSVFLIFGVTGAWLVASVSC